MMMVVHRGFLLWLDENPGFGRKLWETRGLVVFDRDS